MTYKGCYASEYFNPRTSYEVRQYADIMMTEAYTVFQSTHLIRGATLGQSLRTSVSRSFQSTHPMWGATADCEVCEEICEISIHAPHTRCDPGRRIEAPALCHFNPRTPYGVRPTHLAIIHFHQFQSTHLMRGATSDTIVKVVILCPISIHAPRMRCDIAAHGYTRSA